MNESQHPILTILTPQMAERIGLPGLTGEVVEIDYIWPNNVAHNVYHCGRKIAGFLSVEGHVLITGEPQEPRCE